MHVFCYSVPLLHDVFRVQTLHTLQVQALELEAAAVNMSWRGRVRRSINRMLGTDAQSTALPTSMKTQVTICDLLHSRKMIFYTFIMCSLWYRQRYLITVYSRLS